MAQGEDVAEHIVLFGGRTQDKALLNDAWVLSLRWPNATWHQLAPQLPSGYGAPAPRRGHSAVLVPGGNGSSPHMVGGGGACVQAVR